MARKTSNATATGKKRPAKPAKSAPRDAVTIRMYCHGLGDCFLLSFPQKDAKVPYRVLIDCGVLQRSPDEGERLRAVAQNLKDDTGGAIDLLIVTHEHWDHIAGFSHAHEIFKSIKFGQVWLSWAENINDPDTIIIKREMGKKKQAIRAALGAAGRMQFSAGPAIKHEIAVTQQLMNFVGPDESAPLAATGGKKGPSLGETMDWLRDQVKDKNYCVPGQVRSLPGFEGVKVYVLGPPKDSALIRKMNPSGNQGYRRHLNASHLSLVDVIHAFDEDETPPGPFEPRYGIDEEDARIDPFFREFYGFADDPIGDDNSAWRRIDGNWLGGVGQLALQLDTGINNTSLALAFELPGGRTLIFPGDAQIGNWLSWDKVVFKNDAGDTLPVTSKKLLNDAVFYKVAHHGSHNATRAVGGLEEMTSGNLVAMIPTDETFALKQSPPHGWKMPFHELYDALKKYTNYRIARADYDKAKMPEILDDPTSPPAAWTAFEKKLRFADKPVLPGKLERPIWVEYDVVL